MTDGARQQKLVLLLKNVVPVLFDYRATSSKNGEPVDSWAEEESLAVEGRGRQGKANMLRFAIAGELTVFIREQDGYYNSDDFVLGPYVEKWKRMGRKK